MHGDQLILAVDRHATEFNRRIHHQIPILAHNTADMVLDGIPLAIKIQPPGALQIETIRCRIRIPPAQFFKKHGCLRFNDIGRVSFPGSRHIGLSRINGIAPQYFNHAQVIIRFKRPDFRPVGSCRRPNFFDRPRLA